MVGRRASSRVGGAPGTLTAKRAGHRSEQRAALAAAIALAGCDRQLPDTPIHLALVGAFPKGAEAALSERFSQTIRIFYHGRIQKPTEASSLGDPLRRLPLLPPAVPASSRCGRRE